MYANVAYVDRAVDEIIDHSVPMMVTSCGYYRLKTYHNFHTTRIFGRRDYQLLYVASGKTFFTCHGKAYTVTKGQMVLYRPGEPQDYIYHGTDKPEVYWVHFTGSEVQAFLEDLKLPAGENVFLCGSSPVYAQLFDQMIQELQLRRTHYDDLLPLLLRQILLSLNRFLEESRSFGTQILSEMEFAAKYFQVHYHEPICIEDYALSHNMSVCWFNRSFKKLVHMTPMQYILSLRMTNAKKLLDDTDYHISEVARAVGYDNALYFSRLFHKHIGLSPSEYRKNNTT